jgi:hypothetical protein
MTLKERVNCSDTFRKLLLLGFGCPERVQVGWGVSEVQAAFVTTITTLATNHSRA